MSRTQVHLLRRPLIPPAIKTAIATGTIILVLTGGMTLLIITETGKRMIHFCELITVGGMKIHLILLIVQEIQ